MILSTSELLYSFNLAVFVYVLAVVLTKPKHILRGWFVWLQNLERRNHYLAYPLGYCEKCLGGQMALWSWLVYNHAEYSGDFILALSRHVMFIFFTIALIIALRRWFYIEPKDDIDD